MGKARKAAKRSGPEAPLLHAERIWIAPGEGGARFVAWLDRRQAAAVRRPGVLWARRYRLDQTDDRGWRGHLLIYGLATPAARDGLPGAPAHEPGAEREDFAGVHRADERPCHGALELALDAAPAGNGRGDGEAVAAVARRLGERERRKLAARVGHGLAGDRPCSPCIGVCERDADTGLCRGCLRTKKQVKLWKKLDDDGRREVLRRIDARLKLAAA